MASQLFQNYLYTDVGAAIVGATVELFDRNTTTPVRATTTTDANGLWSISHATEGRFDVRITNGASVRWHRYDTQSQIDTLEVANFNIRNPADTFDYAITPGAITADRILNLPVITGTDTVAVLGLAQTFTVAKTFSVAGLTATFVNTNDGASSQVALFEGDRATPADNDLAYISLRLSDSAGNQDEGARIEWQATTVLSGATQDTDLILYALVNNTLTEMVRLDGSANVVVIPTLNITSFGANWTNAGRTVADLGIVTTVDINGGTLAGVTVDGGLTWSAAQNFGANIVFINDTVNSNMTTGLTINQGAADNEAQAWKSSDVGHPITDTAEADTYGTVTKFSATAGGLLLTGFKDADDTAGWAMALRGMLGEAADTTHTATAVAIVMVDARVTNGGTGSGPAAANGNLFAVATDNSVRFLVDTEGDLFADGSDVTVYDDYDDTAMLRAFDLNRGQQGVINSKWDEFVRYNEADLVRVGILGAPRSEGGLINYTLLARFQNGALWQLRTRLEETLERLTLAESRLNALAA